MTKANETETEFAKMFRMSEDSTPKVTKSQVKNRFCREGQKREEAERFNKTLNKLLARHSR